ncbi:MAG: gluconate 2-dehydrogenase subunit 3 family protein [Haliscomenobacter sp.]|uniref:gluconate 2-dehydrogenase subunit 3 family protein n=1 Tax=Haliscomenobacter sp. TaxID=2717303 RepID=UPI0029B6AF1B|nr:gluconate 2-dehydrogenase subunit 3 family protein [Haliscomenobacter sp.]MDX2070059.1 gluconate 2-dehydrogenase subunit 3 family protein [Haliscomenobacter sp.]
MKRRAAMKSLGVALGGLVALPAWANNWTPESVGSAHFSAAADEALLAEIVETFIPETNTPGAKSLKVQQFVQRMIQDCYDDKAKATFQQGLTQTDTLAQQTYSKTFVQCDGKQRIELLKKMSNDASSKAFIGLVKNLTIRGYTNSEYYLVNIAKFTLVPGFYHGCVPVKQ